MLTLDLVHGARGGVVGRGIALHAGLFPVGAIGIFYWHNAPGRTMALGLNQPLTEMSTRDISGRVKAAGE
jgi:hypothetical protein